VSAFLEHYDQNMNDINQKFREAWLAEQAKDPAGYNRIGHKGSIVWRNVDHSFWCLPAYYLPCTKFKWTIPPQHLQALKSLNDVLNHNGIQLIIHVVPNLFDMAARVILPSFRHLPDYRSAFIAKQLLDENIEAIYASDLLIKNYNRFPF